MNKEILLNIKLTPAETDEVIASLNNKASNLEGLAQKIFGEAQNQYKKFVNEKKEKETNKEGENE